MLRMNADGYFPYTPPTQILHGLAKSLDADRGGGAGRGHRAPPPARRGRPPRASSAWGLDLVAERACALFGHRVGHPRAGDGRCPRGHPHRLRGVQHLLRHRPRAARRKGVPHRASGRSQRGHVPHGARHRGDGACPLRCSAPARVGRRGGAGLLRSRHRRSRAPSLHRRRNKRRSKIMSHTFTPCAASGFSDPNWRCPASDPAMIEKAADSAADFVFLDLEDAVAPPEKAQARRTPSQALNDIDWAAQGQDRLGPDQRARHAVHVPRRGRSDGTGGRPDRHAARPEGRRAGGSLHGRGDGATRSSRPARWSGRSGSRR